MTDKTNSSGTWFLSYWCEEEYIENDGDVWNSCCFGKVNKSFAGVPVGSEIYVLMENNLMNIWYVEPNSVPSVKDWEKSDKLHDVWWENHPNVKKIQKTVHIELKDL